MEEAHRRGKKNPSYTSDRGLISIITHTHARTQLQGQEVKTKTSKQEDPLEKRGWDLIENSQKKE